MKLVTSPYVNIDLNYVEFVGIRVDSPEVRNYFESISMDDHVTEATKMIEIGATVLNRVRSSQDMERSSSSLTK